MIRFLLQVWLATTCHSLLFHTQPVNLRTPLSLNSYIIYPGYSIVHLRRRSKSVETYIPVHNIQDVDDLECDMVEYTESSLTTTLAEGTAASDIILTWEPDVAKQIREEITKRENNNVDQPYLVGIVGGPGSGKTTSCYSLKGILSDIGCFVLPFDGYHIPMADLEASPNAKDLIYRRGAPDTFYPGKLLDDIKRIKNSSNERIITIPGFDHEKGDPEPDQHEFNRDEHKVVIVEGLYLLHDDGVWKDVNQQFEKTVFVNADVDLCVERLKIRNLCIPGYTKEEILVRCEVVDRANAMVVERSKVRASLCVDSAAQRTITTTIADGTPESEIERTWEEDVAEKIRKALSERPNADMPYMVAIVGGPGSGKTTSCQVLSEMLDDVGCTVVPFDGYHKPLSVLRKEPNAADLLFRRGSPDTFDAQRLQADLKRIRSGGESLVSIPGFNHAAGDPEDDVHRVERAKHNVVLCEGLYLLHDDPDWKGMKDLFDYTIFMDADVDSCIERLKVRNKCVLGSTEEEIEMRCEKVDRVNANMINKSKKRADLLVESVAQQEEAVGHVV